MADLNPQSAPPAKDALSSPSAEALVSEGRWPGCDYDLKALPERGICPECGGPNTPASIKPIVQIPSALELCIRFGWPIILEVLLGALAFAGTDPGGMMCLWVLVLAAIPLNGAVQAHALATKRITGPWRSQPFVTRWRLFGTMAVILCLLTVIAPFVIFGGCVVLV